MKSPAPKLNDGQRATLAALARQPLCMGKVTDEARGMVHAASAQALVVMGLATVADDGRGRVRVTITTAGERALSMSWS